MNEAVYDRVRERVKEYNLSEQEIKAIDTARQQLNTHTSLGGMTGGLVAYFLGKRKQFKPLQVFAVAAGGFLIGSQMGLVSGSLAGVKTIKQLPDPQRLVNLVRDVQKEMIQTRGHPLPRGPTPPPGAGAPGPHGQQQMSSNATGDEFSMDDYNDYAKLESGFENDQALPPQHPQQKQREPSTSDSWTNLQHEKASSRHQESAWDKIRTQNAPDSAWAKLRGEAQKDPDALNQRKIAQARDQVAKSLQQRSQDASEELPRTREETEHRGGSMRRNQWGDPIE
ncbi:hypothetical protein BDB00DRAFT_877622 [Zychaea mexicana]|uniref:uncharacterized protein n=1 Tax=Zychaea mexicana TaxID=64656 RepID=UPI0022FEA6BA|nr:uncharacterized protein BDB00DRAFT_877622 [Zychaea mexicana]KAI9488236.1 hypothetical protein BDB00DRAFT_877622 [Zychaea mexicana]